MAKDLEGFFKAFPDQKWTTVNSWGIDGFAIVEHTMTGTQKGRLGPLPASNKQVKDWHWLDIMQPTADGKLQHGWGYANLVEVLQQTGALKSPGDKPGKPTAAPGARSRAARRRRTSRRGRRAGRGRRAEQAIARAEGTRLEPRDVRTQHGRR